MLKYNIISFLLIGIQICIFIRTKEIDNKYLAIIAIFNNEGHIIQEWIEHYLLFGVDHIYLVDNNSMDRYQEIVEKYLQRNVVTLIKDSRKGMQWYIYNAVYQKVKKYHKWIMFVDLDEFMYPTKKNSFHDILIHSENKTRFHAPWLLFGSSGYEKQPKYVVPSFLYRHLYNHSLIPHKTILNVQKNKEAVIHGFQIGKNKCLYYEGGINCISSKIKNEKQIFDNFFEFVINHYTIQSLEFFKKIKMTRGDASNNNKNSLRNIKYFLGLDQNRIQDCTLYKKTLLLYLRKKMKEPKNEYVSSWISFHSPFPTKNNSFRYDHCRIKKL